MTETRPPIEHNDVLHHWLVSERSSHASIGEWVKEEWYSAGETNPISPEEMARRGWEYGGPVSVPKEFSDDWDDEDKPSPEATIREEADVARTTDLIKDALRTQEKARDAKDQADAALKDARIALYAANDRVAKLCKQLLEEQLGSAYDARLVLYQMSGRS